MCMFLYWRVPLDPQKSNLISAGKLIHMNILQWLKEQQREISLLEHMTITTPIRKTRIILSSTMIIVPYVSNSHSKIKNSQWFVQEIHH